MAPSTSAFCSSRLEYQIFRLFPGELEHEVSRESSLIARLTKNLTYTCLIPERAPAKGLTNNWTYA